MEQILRENLNRFDDLFTSDFIPEDVITRMDDSSDEIQLCESRTELECPESGKNKKGEDRFIFQGRDKKQCFRISKCMKPDEACNSIVSVPNNHRTSCKQEYVYHEFLTATHDGTVIKDKFKFPVCCLCSVYRD